MLAPYPLCVPFVLLQNRQLVLTTSLLFHSNSLNNKKYYHHIMNISTVLHVPGAVRRTLHSLCHLIPSTAQ